MKLAAIDIGSNSIKLVVAEAAAGGDSFSLLAREKEVVRLGHETLTRGLLSPGAIARAAETVGRFRAVAEARGSESVTAIATASMRAARNAADFVAEVERRTGVRVEVLSGEEEARLIGVASAHGCSGGLPLVNVDIGGGSTEVSLMRDGEARELFSVPLGAVGLTEKFIESDPPRRKELEALRDEVRSAFEPPAREMRGARWVRATGTSGTIIALGDVLRRRREAAGGEIPLWPLARLNKKLAGMTLAERRAVPGISAQRSEIVVAGGQILEGAMRALGINMLRTCDFALREGVVIDRLRRRGADV